MSLDIPLGVWLSGLHPVPALGTSRLEMRPLRKNDIFVGGTGSEPMG